jgi:hypothetical protein
MCPGDPVRSSSVLDRLYSRGLSSLLWTGKVERSEWIADLERHNGGHPRHDATRSAKLAHFILPLKEGMVEVVAEQVSVLRRPGPTTDAAADSLRGRWNDR